jgi:hypothetical protein
MNAFMHLQDGKLSVCAHGSITKHRLDEDVDRIEVATTSTGSYGMMRRKRNDTRRMSKATSMETAVSSIFVLGSTTRSLSQERSKARSVDLALLTTEELEVLSTGRYESCSK